MSQPTITMYLPEGSAITIPASGNNEMDQAFKDKTIIIKTPTGAEYSEDKQVYFKELFGNGVNAAKKITLTFAKSENPIVFP
jgi:mannitol/fructose-specific phosphotransferase system IIA component